MKDRFAVSMFGQKRLSREGGIEIVVKELCTRMAQDGWHWFVMRLFPTILRHYLIFQCLLLALL